MATKLNRGDMVTYGTRTQRVSAKVIRLHRDGSATVMARFFIDANGKQDGPFLGFSYRLDQDDLKSDEPEPAVPNRFLAALSREIARVKRERVKPRSTSTAFLKLALSASLAMEGV